MNSSVYRNQCFLYGLSSTIYKNSYSSTSCKTVGSNCTEDSPSKPRKKNSYKTWTAKGSDGVVTDVRKSSGKSRACSKSSGHGDRVRK